MKQSVKILAWIFSGLVTLLLTSSCNQVSTITPESTFQRAVIPTLSPTHTPTISPTPCPTPFGGGSGRIAFTSDRDGNYEIYVMYPGGLGLTNISNNPSDDMGGAWSPGGTQLAFSSNRDGNNEVYLMNADGSAQKNLTQHPANDFPSSWSPDGKKIAFNSDRDGDFEIFVMNQNGTGIIQITENDSDDYGAHWSPDGNKLVFTSERDENSEIYMINIDGSSQERLTNDPGEDVAFGWSTDGKKIIFSSDRDGDNDIYIMSVDGTVQKNLTKNDDFDFTASWSSDETKIVYSSFRVNPEIDDPPSFDVYIMNVDGSDDVRMSYNPADDYIPLWQPVSTDKGRGVSTCEYLYPISTEYTSLPTVSTPPAIEDIDIEQLLFQPGDLSSDWKPARFIEDCVYSLCDGFGISDPTPSRLASQFIENKEGNVILNVILVILVIFEPSEASSAALVWDQLIDQLLSSIDEGQASYSDLLGFYPFTGEEGTQYFNNDFFNAWFVFFYRCNVFVLMMVDAPLGYSIEYATKLDMRLQSMFCTGIRPPKFAPTPIRSHTITPTHTSIVPSPTLIPPSPGDVTH